LDTDPDIAALRSLASHHDTTESQPLAALLRRVADKLQAADELESRNAPDLPSDPAPAIGDIGLDDGLPNFRGTCISCWDED
jgi:hypothetical protein